MKLTRPEIIHLVNDYIEVHGGYLGDFSYNTHAEFYPYYCDLDINPDDYEGTTRERFIQILTEAKPQDQVKIIKGIFRKYPVSYFDVDEQETKRKIQEEYQKLLIELKRTLIQAKKLLLRN